MSRQMGEDTPEESFRRDLAMRSPAHTPTPWTYTPDVSDIPRKHQYFHIEADGGRVYVGAFDPHVYKESGEANAAFIISAVNAHEDLLNALKKTDALIGGLIINVSGQGQMTIREHCGYEAAIARAEEARQ